MRKKIYFLLILLVLFSNTVYADNMQASISGSITTASSNNVNSSKPTIYSKSAIVLDRTSKKILYEKDAYTKRPMASTTKIMTAILIIEKCNLNDTITVSRKSCINWWFEAWA